MRFLRAAFPLCVLMAFSGGTCYAETTEQNNRPMIGVLAEEIAWSLLGRYEELEVSDDTLGSVVLQFS